MKFQMKINFPWSRPLLACCFVMFALTAMADSFISFRQQGGAFPISTASQMSGICMDAHEKQGVKRAAEDLRKDIYTVSGRSPRVCCQGEDVVRYPILIGTYGVKLLLALPRKASCQSVRSRASGRALSSRPLIIRPRVWSVPWWWQVAICVAPSMAFTRFPDRWGCRLGIGGRMRR